MKANKLFVSLSLLLSIFWQTCIAEASQSVIPFYLRNPRVAQFVRDEVLVKFKDNVQATQANSILSSHRASHLKNINKKGLKRIKIPQDQKVEDFIEQIQQDQNVEYAQPNYIYHTLGVPNDSYYGQQWGINNSGQTIVAANGPGTTRSTNNPGTSGKDIGMVSAWDYITDCSSVVVAVIDSGVNYNHADLSTNMWDGGGSYPNHGYDFVDSDNDPMDLNGHGTHVAGIIGAIGNNSTGAVGVCWQVKIMAIRVADATGVITTANEVQGIDFAVAHGAKIMNMSLGGPTIDTSLNTAITNAQNSGLILIAAAGNDGANNDSGTTPTYPCNYTQTNLLCVAAVDQAFSLASFSNYGSTSVDVAAPGVNIVSLWNGSITSTSDALTSGWTFTGTGTIWGYKVLSFGGTPTNALVNPSTYNHTSTYYDNSADQVAWKSFDTTGAAGVSVSFYIMYDTEDGVDGTVYYAKSSAGDPSSGGTALGAATGTTSGYRVAEEYDITKYQSASTSFGFRFVSNSTTNGFGTNVTSFAINKITMASNIYNVIHGTSMATPYVSGLAAMLLAYNPNYTASDVVAAIKSSGTVASTLSSKTTTGKVINAMSALAFINAPTGLAAVKK